MEKPATWTKGKTEEILVKRNGNEDFYLSLRVGGESKSFVIVKDPPTVTWVKTPVMTCPLQRYQG